MRKELFSILTSFLAVVSFLALLVSSSQSSDLHDVAVIDLVVSPDVSAFPFMNISLNVSVENQGMSVETFNVTANVGNITLQPLRVVDLPSGSNITVMFVWEIYPDRLQIFPPPWDDPMQLVGKNLALKAEAEVVPGETDVSDNVYLDGIVNISWMVTDVDGNGKIDMKDVGSAARAFCSTPGKPGWNPLVDFNSDEKIDMRDVGTSARLFGTVHSLPEIPWLTVEGGNKRSGYWVVVPHNLTFGDFNVSIVLKDLDYRWDLHNATLHLGFNASIIQFHGILYDQLWGTMNHDYKPASPGFLDEIYVTVADPSDTPNGDVPLATIVFNVTHQIISEGEYDDSPLDLYGISLFEALYELPINPERDGLTRVIYFEPSNPFLAVVPDWIEFDRYMDAVGEQFDIDIHITDAHPGWDPKNVTLHLDFNDTVLLDMININFDPIWDETSYAYTPGTPGVSLGQIYMMAAKELDSIPIDDMLIATLTFQVMYQPQCPDPDAYSPLDLHNIVLFEEFHELTTDRELDGIVIVRAYLI